MLLVFVTALGRELGQVDQALHVPRVGERVLLGSHPNGLFVRSVTWDYTGGVPRVLVLLETS